MIDHLHLMLTCSSIFPMIVPRVWYEVEVQYLLELIVEKPRLSNDRLGWPRDDSNHAVEFSCFNVYAPFVTQLRVYGRVIRCFRGERRRACITRARQGSLLPNLTSVTILTSDPYHDSESLLWIDLLASPALLKLYIKPLTNNTTAWVSYLATSNILGNILTTAPAIEELEIYPLDIIKLPRIGRATKLELWSPSLHRRFCSFTQLRRITSSICLLSNRGLATLSALPGLESLSIRGRAGEDATNLDLALDSESSFPRLTKLCPLELDINSLSTLMGTEQLVRGLTSLTLSQVFHGPEQRRISPSNWLSYTLPRTLGRTPRLEHFCYDAGHEFWYDPRSSYVIDDIPLLNAMSNLSLKHVSLLALRFEGSDYLIRMATAWPRISVLRMPNQNVNNAELHWFARLTNLRHLVLRLHFFTLPPAWPYLEGRLDTLESMMDFISMGYVVSADQAARFLLALWPNLRRFDWPLRACMANHWVSGYGSSPKDVYLTKIPPWIQCIK
ncbi:hypothetical protein FRC12_010147 [Ceratobasidium sp. 428]|nr:hypothetical protein FRC12_010147 [Ceratobasidium sp. 428]